MLFAAVSSLNAACIDDDTGQRVCLDKKPERIISLYGAYSELLWRTEAGGAVVGRTKSDDTIPEMEKLPVVGTGLRPNPEYVLALSPDLVVARSGKAGSDALTNLRERGVKVAAFDPQSLAELYLVINRLGVLTGREDKATALAAGLREGIEAVRNGAAKYDKKPTVVFEISAEPLTVAGSEGLINELIALAGGVNAISQKKRLVRLDAEALLAANPDFYFVQVGPMNLNPQPPAERTHHARLKAVAEGRVKTVDEKLFSRPGPNVVPAAQELLKLMHP